MAKDDLRKRLDRLNRKPLPPGKKAPADAAEPIVFSRDLQSRRPAHAQAPKLTGPPVVLEDVVDGREVEAADGSKVFLVERRLADSTKGLGAISEQLAEAIASEDCPLRREVHHAGLPARPQPEDLIFFDLETTGLSSSPLFLIGTMVWEDGDLVTRQYFARDYSQERGALGLFLESAAGRRLFVSFNGKSFDLPFVRARSAVNAVACDLEAAHLDLLHAGRRMWRRQLPDCRLQTLERHICGRTRQGDIPGHLIPDAYHEYVRTENAAQMVAVLEHNFLDLVTLADLMIHMHRGG